MSPGNGGNNRIDPTPVRISTDVTIDRQTPKSDFGDRLQAGAQATAGALANGAAIVSPLIPGAGIVSAAVSSVGGGGVGMSRPYVASTGVTSVGGPLITSVGASASGGVPSSVTGGSTDSSFGDLLGQANQLNNTTDPNSMLSGMAAEEQNMLMLQMKMQQESQVYQALSNVLKTRNDTAKNAIGNIR